MPPTTNGRIPKTPDLKEIREQRRTIRARLKLAGEKQLLESLALWDDYSFGGQDLWDRLRPLTNDAGEFWQRTPPNVPHDRAHGADWPLWWTLIDLDALRAESRVRAASNSFAIGLIRNLVNNVIGKGFSYKAAVVGPDGKPVGVEDLTAQGKELQKSVQGVIDGFLKLNHWNGTIDPRSNLAVAGTREREIYRTRFIDGECFLRFHRQDDGTCLVRIIDAAQVRDGGGRLVQDGWFLGIQHRMDPFEDVETPETYAVSWPDPSAKGGEGGSADDQGSWEEVDAADVLHIKGADTPSTVKRGTPELVWDTGRALDRAAKLQRNASMAAAIRAAIAETWQFEQAMQAQINTMAAALSERSGTNPATGKTEYSERVSPGTVRRGPAGATLVPPSADNTEVYLAGVQGDLQQASAASCSPAFWLGDTANANYSNLESASAPAVRAGTCDQEYWKVAFCRAVWKAVEWAVQCGLLPKDTGERVVIQVDAPAVLHRNELEKAQEDQINVQGGWKDRQTCAAERGLDWRTVQANNQEYTDEQQAAGVLPMPGDDDEEGGDKPSGKGPVKPKTPTTESRLAKIEAGLTRLLEGKDASGHEHAADGKFGKGGSKKNQPGTNKKKADPDAFRPSRPENRHAGSAPKVQPWQAPPPKKPKAEGAGKFVRPSGDASQTALGDHTELLSTQLGFRNILPEGKRTAAGTEDKKGSIDVEFDHSGRAYELKMCKTTSTEYRLKAKASEKEAKLAYAKKYKLKPYTMVAVRDVDKNECHFYASKKPGMIGSEVNDRDYDFVGTVKF